MSSSSHSCRPRHIRSRHLPGLKLHWLQPWPSRDIRLLFAKNQFLTFLNLKCHWCHVQLLMPLVVCSNMFWPVLAIFCRWHEVHHTMSGRYLAETAILSSSILLHGRLRRRCEGRHARVHETSRPGLLVLVFNILLTDLSSINDPSMT